MGMGKSKATPICPYVFHMYHAHKLLLPVKKKEYQIAEALLKHNMEPEEGELEASEESEHESLSSQEIREIQAQRVQPDGEIPLKQERITGKKGAHTTARDLSHPRVDRAQLPRHHRQRQDNLGTGACSSRHHPGGLQEARKLQTGRAGSCY